MKKMDIKLMVQIALITAVICVLSPFSISIPVSPVPISLTIFAIYLGVYTLGWKWGTLSCLLYILIGLAGIPVFANFTAGPSKLFGPTGGYIIGYLFVAVLAGLFIDKFEKKIYMHVVGMVLGTAICYALGTTWLAYQANMTFSAALAAGVIPFIPADVVKIVIAIIVGPQLRKAVKRINNAAVNEKN